MTLLAVTLDSANSVFFTRDMEIVPKYISEAAIKKERRGLKKKKKSDTE